jgi:hypothetical protein
MREEHKHYNTIIKWASNPKNYNVYTKGWNNSWVVISNPRWNEKIEYILVPKEQEYLFQAWLKKEILMKHKHYTKILQWAEDPENNLVYYSGSEDCWKLTKMPSWSPKVRYFVVPKAYQKVFEAWRDGSDKYQELHQNFLDSLKSSP